VDDFTQKSKIPAGSAHGLPSDIGFSREATETNVQGFLRFRVKELAPE
jgi:hypothetical protein